MRLAIRFAYDGTRFDSYARQPGRSTVEGALIAALEPEGYVADSFKAGSRTDAGVSALENVCAATVERSTLRGIVPTLQRNLPDGLWVTAAAPVDPTFNPRHAHTRVYSYFAVPRGEDLEAMQAACQRFVGRHHMGAFARMEEGRNPERTVRGFTVEPGPLWQFRTTSDGYLWNQVRRMVGAALAVGRGEASPEDVSASLATGVAHPRFGVAPAGGLALASVQYHGLAWDPLCGRLGAQRIPPVLQSAAVGSLLAGHLDALAPWPAGRPPG